MRPTAHTTTPITRTMFVILESAHVMLTAKVDVALALDAALTGAAVAQVWLGSGGFCHSCSYSAALQA